MKKLYAFALTHGCIDSDGTVEGEMVWVGSIPPALFKSGKKLLDYLGDKVDQPGWGLDEVVLFQSLSKQSPILLYLNRDQILRVTGYTKEEKEVSRLVRVLED